MSAVNRLISGTAAAWVQMAVGFAAQVILVPLFLSRWDRQTYGVWLTIQAVAGFATIVDMGHQNFLGNEFLKLGASNRAAISRTFYSALPVALAIGAVELAGICLIVASGASSRLLGLGLGGSGSLMRQAGLVMVIQSGTWLLAGSAGGIAGRVLLPFGYYPRLAWWGVLSSGLTAAAPAIAVAYGATFLEAGVVLAAATLLYNVALFADIWRLVQREGLLPLRPDFALGARNFFTSIALTAKSLLEMARQQGVRLILNPLIGASEMAAFATMRTGANVALQGLNTVTNPLMPELMRYLNLRDQDRSEGAFGFVWLLVIAIMGPAVVVLQWLVGPVFELWTRAKIPFDPYLFAALSIGVLVFAVAQPAEAILQGNNLLRPQLLLSIASGGTLFVGLALLVPLMGKRGAGAALIGAEAVSLTGYTMVAGAWLRENAMRWPASAFTTVLGAVALHGATALFIAGHPAQAPVAVVMSMLATLGVAAIYWRQLPEIARQRVVSAAATAAPAISRLRTANVD